MLAREKNSFDQGGKVEPHQNDIPKFIFCINMMIPGPPHYHFLFYFASDDFDINSASDTSTIKDSQATVELHSKLLHEFFFGPSDEFRNKTLKMIPRIVKGDVFLKAAVGRAPIILGNKLKQTFVRTDRFLEVIIDMSSSSMTERLLNLSAAYVSSIFFSL